MKQIPLTRGQFALVDNEDYDFLIQWNWSARRGQHDNTYYARRTDYSTGQKKEVIMHRLIMKAEKGQMIDHIDGNGLNDQKSNLRFCTPSQNQSNCRRRSGANMTSRFLGVSLKNQKIGNRTYTCWIASLTHNKKSNHIGCFKSETDAAKAYNIKAKELHGDFAVLNTI